MSGINGIECVKQVRKKGFKMPILLSSGSLKFEDDLIDKYSVTSTLQKPYEFDTMLSTIKKLI